MTQQKKLRRHRLRESQDLVDMIAICLSDGPRTVAQIEEQFLVFGRRLGMFAELHEHDSAQRGKLKHDVRADLDRMVQEGWLVRQGELYELTTLGQAEAGKRLEGLRKVRALGRRLLRPQAVSQVSLVVHLGLAALKLPAALLSRSVGLLNDATDTLLDGLSSLLVYAGLRLDKERAVNVLLVVVMLVTGGFTFYGAVQRFFVPFEPEVDWFTFAATLVSAVVCTGLWGYQRYVGLRRGSVALITQSVDSRNHIIVAASVTAGLVASLLRFSLLDTLVGLVVAGLILKSAVELALETIPSLGEEQADLSRYRMAPLERYREFRLAQLRDWMLYLVEAQGVLTRQELQARAGQAMDYGSNPALRELGLDTEAGDSGMTEQCAAELFERGWLAENGHLTISAAGRERLKQVVRRTRGRRHGL
jgi:Co/Zn/Cd efflux system component